MRRICDRVYAFLQANTNARVSASEVAGALGLEYQTVVYAVHLLRRHYRLPIPITTKLGRGGGYRISSADEEVRPYRRGEMGYVQTRVGSLRDCLAEYLTTQAASANPVEAQAARLLMIQADRLLQDIGMLVPNGTP